MAQSHILVPATLKDSDLARFFASWRWLASPMGPVVLDLREANFLAPWALALFAGYGLWLKESRKKHVTILLDPRSVAGGFAVDLGLPELLSCKLSASSHAAEPRADRTVPLTRIRTSADIPQFAARVMQVLEIPDPDMEGAVKYSLVELLRNVVQHARTSVGGLATAQFFPKTGLVELVVVDPGIGIKTALGDRYPEIDADMKALKFAMQPHVSGTFDSAGYDSMKDNAGLGLFFIKQIATLSGGGFFLGSGDTLADLWVGPDDALRRRFHGSPKGGWPGTFAVVQLRKDSIADFNAVLRTCRELAAEARKYPAEQALDFLDEVPEIEGLLTVRVKEFEENVEEAARIRDNVILPALEKGRLVVLDFSGVRFATQSFVHACIYKLLRDDVRFRSAISIVNCTDATKEAIQMVAAYARLGGT